MISHDCGGVTAYSVASIEDRTNNANFCLLPSINIHLRFKVLHKVFRYIKLIYNYLHDKKKDHPKVIKSLATSKHIYQYIQN